MVEKSIIADVSSLWKAISILMTWYYIVDIAYPSVCLNILLFAERALLNLPLSGKMNNSALQTISAIDHMEQYEEDENNKDKDEDEKAGP